MLRQNQVGFYSKFLRIAVNRVLGSILALSSILGLFIFPVPVLVLVGLLWAVLEVRYWFLLCKLFFYWYDFQDSTGAAGAGPAA